MKNLLIIAANRSLMTVKRNSKTKQFEYMPSSGGLATALSALKDYRIVNIGWPGLEIGEDEESVILKHFQSNDMMPIFLSQQEKESFYDGCNKVLWFLMHETPKANGGAIADIEWDNAFWPSYKAINQRFATAVCERVSLEQSEHSKVWIHDYHLMLAPEFIKRQTPDAKVGFFLHIPFPPYATFKQYLRSDNADEVELGQKLKEILREILIGLRAVDHLAFHTAEFRDNFIECMQKFYGVVDTVKRGDKAYIIVDDKRIKISVTPIGIDYDRYAADYGDDHVLENFYAGSSHSADTAEIKQNIRAIQQYKKAHGHQKTILSVQRLDPSKGILEQLDAYERLIKTNPLLAHKTRFRLLVVPSRLDIKAYAELKAAVGRRVAEINRFAKAINCNAFIDYIFQSYPLAEICSIYREADTLFIPVLRDGMNLVCQEYIAAHQDKLGNVVLGRGAGAADSLCQGQDGAIGVDAREHKSVYQGLVQALTMSPQECQQRMAFLHKVVETNDVHNWADQNLAPLTKQSPKLHPTPSTSPTKSLDGSGGANAVVLRERSNSHPPKYRLFSSESSSGSSPESTPPISLAQSPALGQSSSGSSPESTPPISLAQSPALDQRSRSGSLVYHSSESSRRSSSNNSVRSTGSGGGRDKLRWSYGSPGDFATVFVGEKKAPATSDEASRAQDKVVRRKIAVTVS